MASIVSRPAQYSYQTGNPTQGEQRNKDLKSDFTADLNREESQLPANAQEHFKKQRDVQQKMGQQSLAMTRGGGILRKIKVGSTT